MSRTSQDVFHDIAETARLAETEVSDGNYYQAAVLLQERLVTESSPRLTSDIRDYRAATGGR